MKETLTSSWGFFKRALDRWEQTAAVVPSSRFLSRALTRHAELRRAAVVVELGAGTGNVTRAILREMRADARLIAIEIDASLAEQVRATLVDPRLEVICGSAADLPQILAAAGVRSPVDVVISGLGMSMLAPAVREAVVDGVRSVLADAGIFVLFGYVHARALVWSRRGGFSRFNVRGFLAERFGSLEREVITLNLPPAAVYTCRRSLRASPPPAAGSAAAG